LDKLAQNFSQSMSESLKTSNVLSNSMVTHMIETSIKLLTEASKVTLDAQLVGITKLLQNWLRSKDAKNV
jgi:hypothetical protein